MSSILSEIFLEAESGSGISKPVKSAGPPKRVRHFICDSADHTKVESLLSMSVSDATLVSTVESALAVGISWIYNAIGLLRVSPRSAATTALFRAAFAQNPDWNPTWKDKTMKWVDWGDLVATRLEKAAFILNGGDIKYFCYGSPKHCSECTAVPPNYYACSSWKGKYVMCLGEGFWRDWKNGDQNSMISTLIHESLHIYFNKTVAHDGRSKNVSCYLRFVALANKSPLPSRIATRCPASP